MTDQPAPVTVDGRTLFLVGWPDDPRIIDPERVVAEIRDAFAALVPMMRAAAETFWGWWASSGWPDLVAWLQRPRPEPLRSAMAADRRRRNR